MTAAADAVAGDTGLLNEGGRFMKWGLLLGWSLVAVIVVRACSTPPPVVVKESASAGARVAPVERCKP